MKPSLSAIRRCLLAFAAERGPEKTFCPSEVARQLADSGWRHLMPEIRAIAAKLAQAGQLRCTQRGHDVDPTSAKGPIRLSQPDSAK